MSAVIITAILLLLAAGAFIWIVNSAIGKSCPQCGPEQMIIPIIPSFLAWCPQCGQSYQQNELVEARGEPEDQSVYQQQTEQQEVWSPEQEVMTDDLEPLPIIDPEEIISGSATASPGPEEENINHGPPRF